MSQEIFSMYKDTPSTASGSSVATDTIESLRARVAELEADRDDCLALAKLNLATILDRQKQLAAQALTIKTLRKCAEDASTSLETIALRSFGEESYLDSKPQMRAFAGARAGIARQALAIPDNSTEILQSWLDRVLGEPVAWRYLTALGYKLSDKTPPNEWSPEPMFCKPEIKK